MDIKIYFLENFRIEIGQKLEFFLSNLHPLLNPIRRKKVYGALRIRRIELKPTQTLLGLEEEEGSVSIGTEDGPYLEAHLP